MSRILAIDYGKKRVGLAVAQNGTKVALPFGIIENKGRENLIKKLQEICREEKIGQIVVGLPIGLAGKPTEQTKKTKNFIATLKEKFDLPVDEQSEVFTSRQAKEVFKQAGIKKRRVDASAAVLILADYLER